MKFPSLVLVAALSATAISAFTTSPTSYAASRPSALHNVPPPASDDVEAIREYSSKQPPPASFFQLQQDCLAATQRAISDGLRLMEVEFPPLPANVLELDDVSAYDVAQANLQLAVEFSRGITQAADGIDSVAILLPDEDEKAIAIERFTGKSRDQVNEDTYKVEPGVIVSSLRRTEEGDERLIKVRKNKHTRYTRCTRTHRDKQKRMIPIVRHEGRRTGDTSWYYSMRWRCGGAVLVRIALQTARQNGATGWFLLSKKQDNERTTGTARGTRAHSRAHRRRGQRFRAANPRTLPRGLGSHARTTPQHTATAFGIES